MTEISMHEIDNEDKKAFTSLLEAPTRKVSERDFIRFFLPLFTNKKTEENVDIGKWLDVAGHANQAVDVVGPDGKTLFTVPPLLQDIEFKSLPGGREHSLYEVVNLAREKAKIHPRYGIAHLEQGLANRIDKANLKLDTINQFNSIFERYGVEKIELPKEVTKNETVDKQQQDNQITGFEDF